MTCGAGAVEQRAAVQYREKMWGTLGQEGCLLQELIHHMGCVKTNLSHCLCCAGAEGGQLQLPHKEQ